MVSVNADVKGGFRRLELLTGPGRRRRWSAEEKARIVAETLRPGASVSEVARRWQVCAQQVFGWRRAARVPADAAMGFVPIVTEVTAGGAAPSSSAALIEVKLAGAVVRVRADVDEALLTVVLRAVRASAVVA